ncbi:MAG: acylphosphatase [candidate division Zixibacteria bacterium]|nr:acylphosphatase [candidate division Zixibacteria bacterium]
MSYVAAEIKITGLVQGVGFRYFCHRTAKDYSLTGCVRNEPDRSVLVIAEGDKSQIESFIKSLNVGPSFSNVKNITVRWTEFSGKYNSFRVES